MAPSTGRADINKTLQVTPAMAAWISDALWGRSTLPIGSKAGVLSPASAALEARRDILVEFLGFTNLLCAGMLAGEEFNIRYGVRAPVASLGPQPEIQLRQALIRRLRVLVSAIFGLAFFSGISVTLLEGFGPGFGFPARDCSP